MPPSISKQWAIDLCFIKTGSSVLFAALKDKGPLFGLMQLQKFVLNANVTNYNFNTSERFEEVPKTILFIEPFFTTRELTN